MTSPGNRPAKCALRQLPDRYLPFIECFSAAIPVALAESPVPGWMPDQRMRLRSAIFPTNWAVEAQSCMRELLCNTVPDLAAASWHLTGTESGLACYPRHGRSTREARAISRTNRTILGAFPYSRSTFMLDNGKSLYAGPFARAKKGDLMAQALPGSKSGGWGARGLTEDSPTYGDLSVWERNRLAPVC